MSVSFLGLMVTQESIEQGGDDVLLFRWEFLNIGYFFDQRFFKYRICMADQVVQGYFPELMLVKFFCYCWSPTNNL